MNGLQEVSKATQGIKARDRESWIPLYYSITEDAVFTEDGNGRYLITNMINPNSEDDIRETVEAWKRS